MSVKHWTSVVNQAVVQRAKNGSFNLCIEGGSEYGQFLVIGDVLADRVIFRSGSLNPGEIILEINGKHVGGYTQTDGISLIKDSSDSLYITSVYPGLGISRDLRKYLGTRFPKGTVDHELQQTIRDNLYMRTVPCTTRKPRNGETPGVDYDFLTVDQYLELERSGKLLESGFYESNYYGTPKPPKTPMTPGTGTIRRPKTKKTTPKENGVTGPLPDNWEVAYTKDGEIYFVDHNTGRTQWDDPRKQKQPRQSTRDYDDDLPPGWEKVDDPKYGTYYIDHVNRKTQYERPDSQPRRKSSHSSRIFGRTEPQPKSYDEPEKKLTIDARKLQGDTFRVSLRKGAKGFGFTIVGGEQPGEVLQVNNIVRGGAADTDGRLRTGDIIMRLNGRNVLSWSHSDIIRILQQTRVGEIVELDVVRGYPLPFDPSDPSVKKVGYTIVNGQDNMRRSVSDASLVSDNNNRDYQKQVFQQPSAGMKGSKSSGYLSEGENTYNSRRSSENRLGATTPVAFRSGPPSYTVVPIVRGPRGFGFTIADSPYGQRVKEIIDRARCQGLYQGDVLIRINDTVVHNLEHVDVVEVLKSCRMNETTNFQVQRSGVLTVVKSLPPNARRNIPRPKSMPAFDDEQPIAPAVRSSTSMGVIATNGEASNVNSTTYEGRNHPQVSEAGEGYKSLKRAVQSHSRDVDASHDSGLGFVDHVITLQRGSGGFGFQVIGGQEESTQVSIATIVKNGAADKDGRLREKDIILAVDGINVVDASHKRVISLMRNAGLNGQVTLRIRRKTDNQEADTVSNSSRKISSGSAFKAVRDRDDNRSSPSQYLHTRSKSQDNESINSDKQVAEWIEDQRRPRDFQPYRESNNQSNGLRSKSESNILNRPKSCPPPVKPKPNMNHVTDSGGREIVLSRNVNEGFGFVIMSSPTSNGPVIGRIIPGSPSDRCGDLSVNDKLIAVNGHSVNDMTHSEIVSMVKNSGLQVRLTIESSSPQSNNRDSMGDEDAQPPPPRPAEPRNYTPTSTHSYNRQTDNLRDEYLRQKQEREEQYVREIRARENQQPLRPKSAPINANQGQGGLQRVTVSSIEPNQYRTGNASMTREDRQYIQESAKRKITTGEPTEVILHKGERGFGFSIRGGEGMPLFVLRIAEDGPAWRDGRIQVGDEILEINGKNAEVMSHAEAVNTIRNCKDTAKLLIRRPKQPMLSDRLPNGHAASQQQQQHQQQYDRPKSGYY